MDGRMVEEWRDIPGFDGDYQVSTTGIVKSYKRSARGKILKQYEDRYGYLKVVLYKNDKPHYFTVHRLVAMTFLPKMEGENSVDHIDFNRKNNNLENLRWCTEKENTKHSYDAGRLSSRKPMPIIGISPKGNKMHFRSIRDAERITGVGYTIIRKRLMGETTAFVGWHFYKEAE